jgi:hypothetical protein
MEQHDAAQPQRVFQHEDDVRFWNGPDRDQAYGALDPRVDRIADAHDIAEHDFGDGGDRRVLEVEIETAIAARRILWPFVGNRGYLHPFVERCLRGAALAGRGTRRGIHRLVRAGHDVQRTHLVEDVNLRTLHARAERGRVAAGQQAERRQKEGRTNAAADRWVPAQTADAYHNARHYRLCCTHRSS